jgi:hypothetical protein
MNTTFSAFNTGPMSGRQLVIKDAKREKLIRILLHWVGYYSNGTRPEGLREIDIGKASFLGCCLGFRSACGGLIGGIVETGLITTIERRRQIPWTR